MTMDVIGRTTWVIPDGRMPLVSTGPEPTFTSHDKLCLLNAGDEMANVEIAIYHADREPVAPYRLTIAPRRVRHIRFNDLIFPQAIPLETAYAAIAQADVPIAVQFSRQDTGRAAMTIAGSTAFPDDAPQLPQGKPEEEPRCPNPLVGSGGRSPRGTSPVGAMAPSPS